MRMVAVTLVLALAAGCMNLYVRCPGTDQKIEDTYQCTADMTALSYVVMFPQTMSCGGSKTLMAENLLTIPIGCLCFVDVVLEAVVDTLCYPYDLTRAKRREK